MLSILQVEWMKMSKSNIIISVLIPSIILLMGWIFFVNGSFDRIGLSWETFLLQLHVLIVLFIPMGITIIACSLVNVEHKAKSWKFLFALPVKKSKIYLSKLVYITFFILLSHVILFVGMILLGRIYIDTHTPILLVFKQIFYPFLASLPIIAFQLLFSILVKNQAFPFIFGIFTSVFSYTLSIFPISIGNFLFWLYPSLASPLILVSEGNNITGFDYSEKSYLYALLGITMACILNYIGIKRISTKDIY